MSLKLVAVVTPVANLPAVEAFVTARAPGCRPHRCASTDNRPGVVGAGARQLVDVGIAGLHMDARPGMLVEEVL